MADDDSNGNGNGGVRINTPLILAMLGGVLSVLSGLMLFALGLASAGWFALDTTITPIQLRLVEMGDDQDAIRGKLADARERLAYLEGFRDARREEAD